MMDVESSSNFNIYHNNIRSLFKNLNELKIYLSQFSFNFDIIVLTETWHLYDLTLLSIPNYDLIYSEGRLNQNDEVVLYIKSSFDYTSEIIDLDGIKLISVKFCIHNKSYIIRAVYRPP